MSLRSELEKRIKEIDTSIGGEFYILNKIYLKQILSEMKEEYLECEECKYFIKKTDYYGEHYYCKVNIKAHKKYCPKDIWFKKWIE